MNNEQRAHDLAVAIVLNRHIEEHLDAYEEYCSAYKSILYKVNQDFTSD